MASGTPAGSSETTAKAKSKGETQAKASRSPKGLRQRRSSTTTQRTTPCASYITWTIFNHVRRRRHYDPILSFSLHNSAAPPTRPRPGATTKAAALACDEPPSHSRPPPLPTAAAQHVYRALHSAAVALQRHRRSISSILSQLHSHAPHAQQNNAHYHINYHVEVYIVYINPPACSTKQRPFSHHTMWRSTSSTSIHWFGGASTPTTLTNAATNCFTSSTLQWPNLPRRSNHHNLLIPHRAPNSFCVFGGLTS